MLISPDPVENATTTTIESLYGTPKLPLRKSEYQKERASMPDTEVVELPAAAADKMKPSVLRLENLDRVPNDADDGEISSVTDGLLSSRRPSPTPLSPPQWAAFSLPRHPLFPPLPIYDHPPSTLETLRYLAIRSISFVLSLLFLLIIILGALFCSIWLSLVSIGHYFQGKAEPQQRRFHAEERARRLERTTSSRKWKLRQEKREVDEEVPDDCPPLEGGKDLVIGDVAYYARRVGLDVETFKVETEDGFILTLWHLYNPQEYNPLPASERGPRGPNVFSGGRHSQSSDSARRKYPILLMHGLLQNSGAYCANDDDSLAFFLCKSGYDVWLGNNRCGLQPEHTTMLQNDPRMWSWTIQHMGVFDITALTSRVLFQTGYEKLGLVCHSQGTAQTFIALAKSHRPELGKHISVFCALAPAVYAGPLVERIYFRFMRLVSPAAFRLIFGIHSFIPFMLTVQRWLHSRIYGKLGYVVFSYLFNWSDDRWDCGLRDRLFQFAPVYVSSETIRWWLGADGFSTHECILATRDSCLIEIDEDRCIQRGTEHETSRSDTAWYGPNTPPFALWVGGSDQLVDGRKLLQRFRNGREPHVQLAHAKVIEEYEHLDVLWAMDMIEQVGCEVRQVLWDTMPADARTSSVIPRGVE